MSQAPTLVLVTGLPGTGKSAVAAVAADVLRTSVVAHDWAMSGLREYPAVQTALGGIEMGPRVVGWSILAALAQAQLVEGRSVVLDGVARRRQRDDLRELAQATGSSFVTLTTFCSDADLHRDRIETRQRHIPNWYDLRWEDVERNASEWVHEPGDLDLDAARPWETNVAAVRQLLKPFVGA